MNGVIERVIENWLTNANERSYQLAFCQLLASEGESVVYVSPHGPLEQGKDVITLDKRGRLKAYQLKCGDFSLKDWRNHKGELNDLIELPITHPGVSTRRKPECFLVTNGEIKDPALNAITAANISWKQRKYPILQTLSRGALLTRFLAAHGRCLPKELTDFNLFLELILADGRAPLAKDKVSRLLETVLPVAKDAALKKGEIRRSIASAVLLMGYVLQNAYNVNNHWAVFEGWTLAGAYLIGIASQYDLADESWTDSFSLCEIGAQTALQDLCVECEGASTLVQGDPFTDGHLYPARITILTGLLAALELHSRINRSPAPRPAFAAQFVRTWRFKMKTWGESATPFFVVAALATEAANEQAAAEALVLNTLGTILQMNGDRSSSGMGLPSPYYSPEDCLGFAYGTKERPKESFSGATYTAHPLIDFLARRLRRQALRPLWYPIARMTMKSLTMDTEIDWFRWRSKDGVLNSRFLGSPQSWSALVDDANSQTTDAVPKRLKDRSSFAVFYSLVYPHRFNRSLLWLIESAVNATPQQSMTQQS
jgi:hypothetical protein